MPSNPLSVWTSCGLMRSIKISLSSLTRELSELNEIIDQHLASRIRMPLGRIERRQQIVELAGARIEIDLGGQSLDQPIDLVDVLLHESRRKGFEMLDLRGRRRGRKCVRHQVTDLAAVKVDILPAPQRIETHIELALEPIDHERIETGETILADELIKPILPLD